MVAGIGISLIKTDRDHAPVFGSRNHTDQFPNVVIGELISEGALGVMEEVLTVYKSYCTLDGRFEQSKSSAKLITPPECPCGRVRRGANTFSRVRELLADFKVRSLDRTTVPGPLDVPFRS